MLNLKPRHFITSSELALLSLMVAASPVRAQINLGETDGITNPVTGKFGTNEGDVASSGATFVSFFVLIWRALITVGGLAVLIFFLWGALEWIMAGGDSGKMQKARDKITQSIIGLVILVSSFTLIAFISQLFFGEEFNLLQLTFPTPENITPGTTGGGGGNVWDDLVRGIVRIVNNR
jgi:hypothetical protein